MRPQDLPPHPWVERPRLTGWRRSALDVALGAVAASICTGIGWACLPWGDLSFFIMIFLVGAVVMALWRGRLASGVASVMGMLAFDYFFERPYFSLSVSNWVNFAVFTGFLGISQLVANLVYILRLQARESVLRERETAGHYVLSRALSGESSPAGVRRAAEQAMASLLGVPVQVLLGCADLTQPGIIPLTGTAGPLGAIQADLSDQGPQQSFLEACAEQVASALERALLAEEAERAHTKAELEQTRNTLLSAVSHDFRTPLATIQGAACTLAQEEAIQSSPELRELTDLVVSETSRLGRMVGNLLDLIRLEDGALKPHFELQPFEEVVGTVLNRLEPLMGTISVDLPEDLPPVALDSMLVEQLLTNLLENAFRHGMGRQVRLMAQAAEEGILVEVADRGAGLPEDLKDRIFEKFYRPPGSSADGGIGLGLAICKAIVRVHGGRIWVEDDPGGGALFRFTLPLNASRKLP